MLKQQERIVRNGDYYEIETFEELMMTSKTSKKEETIVSSTNIPASQYIITEMPTFKEARSNYFFNAIQKNYENKGAQQLKKELESMIKEQGLNDEDQKQIEKLIDQISNFNDNKEVVLNSLPQKSEKKSEAKNIFHKKINLKAKFGIKQLQQKVKKLQDLDYPELSFLEHQLQIMLGEKKPIQSVSIPAQIADEKTRQQLNNLYTHFSKMESVNKISQIVNKISYNNDKYVEMGEWVDKISQISQKNYDFLSELKEDEAILKKLQTNFDSNVAQVKQILKEVSKK